MESAAHLVIVFPSDKSKAALGPLFTRVMEQLTRAGGGEPPCNLYPDTTAVCLFVNGALDAITRGLEEAVAIDTQYVVLPVGSPFEARGLSKSVTWLRRHPR